MRPQALPPTRRRTTDSVGRTEQESEAVLPSNRFSGSTFKPLDVIGSGGSDVWSV